MRVLILTIAFLIAGCTTYSNDHYALMQAPSNDRLEETTEKLRVAIEPLLLRSGLSSKTHLQTSDSVLLYYTSDSDSALRVGIRLHEGNVVLDTFQYRSGAGDSEQYSHLRTELLDILSNLDGVSVVEVDGPII